MGIGDRLSDAVADASGAPTSRKPTEDALIHPSAAAGHAGQAAARRRAVFLDRDGVLNEAAVAADGTPHPPASVAALTLLPGVAEACFQLRAAGFLLIVVTNQPDVARGRQRSEEVEAIHAALLARLPLDDVRVCYHDDADGCACRKPKAGMLLDAARAWDIDLEVSYLVGDRWRDIGAGRAAGCRTVLVDYGYAEGQKQEPDARVLSLADAAVWILQPSGDRKAGR